MGSKKPSLGAGRQSNIKKGAQGVGNERISEVLVYPFPARAAEGWREEKARGKGEAVARLQMTGQAPDLGWSLCCCRRLAAVTQP